MSIDLPLSSTANPSGPQRPGSDARVRDLIVVFGGWQPGVDPQASGTPLPETGSGTADLVAQIKSITPMPFHQTLIVALQGSLPSPLGVAKALSFIKHNFHPQGMLIIYGYSAGGTDAMALCRQVGVQMKAYGMTSGQTATSAQADALTKRKIDEIVDVRVDLLITVDAAAGPASARVNRIIPKCVRRNLNFYQTTESRIFSRGGRNYAEDSTLTQVDNVDLTSSAEHSTIDDESNNQALAAIEACLGIEAVPAVAPAGAAYG